MPEDEKLSCMQLKNEFAETRRFKQEAKAVKEANTGANMTRVILFWPALLKTMHNADVAIMAANDRNFHLVKLMKKRKCKNLEAINAEIKGTSGSQNSITAQLRDLNEMYKSGVLTKEEFEKAKKKTLSQ